MGKKSFIVLCYKCSNCPPRRNKAILSFPGLKIIYEWLTVVITDRQDYNPYSLLQRLNKELLELERWLSGYKQLLFLQRTWLQLQHIQCPLLGVLSQPQSGAHSQIQTHVHT